MRLSLSFYVKTVNMADAAAARREARRKKILENSHNRLQLISGKSDDENPKVSPIRSIVHEPEHNHDIYTPLESIISNSSINNGIIFNETELLNLLPVSHDAAGDGEVLYDLAPFVSPPPAEPTPQQSLWEKLIYYRYDIVCLSLLIQLLYSFSVVTFDNTYFFVPVLVYVITKLFRFPMQNNSKFANVLMLLQGISSVRIQRLLFITQCVNVIFGDICVYLFTTICIQSLFVTLKDVFNT